MHKPKKVTLKDGNALEATAQSNVSLEMRLSAGKTKRCISRNVVCAPKLAYNLLSITKASEVGKVVKFDHSCEIIIYYEYCTPVEEYKAQTSYIAMVTSTWCNLSLYWTQNHEGIPI